MISCQAEEKLSDLPLWQAFKKYADPVLVAEFQSNRRRLKSECRWNYDPDRPDEPVLSEFDGLGHHLEEEARQIMKKIERRFISMLEAGQLVASGRHNSPLVEREKLPASAWAVLTIADDIRKNLVVGPGLQIFDVRVSEQDRAEATGIRGVEKPPHTGAPGRPSSMHLIEQEFVRRRNAKTLEPSLQREGDALAAWLASTHPELPPATSKTIRNRLRKSYRDAMRFSQEYARN
jgi:hypothetical protein